VNVTKFLRASALLAITCVTTPGWAQTAPATSQTQTDELTEAGFGEDFGLSLSTGVNYSSGDYGAAEKTKLLVVPLSARARSGPVRFSATLPWLRIDSPGNIVGGGTGGPIIIDPNAPATREVRKGFGDLSLGATYSLPPASLAGFDLDLSGRVKLPTSSERKSLGTGKTDFALSTEISRSVGLWTPFLTLGYRFLGDPEGVDLRNGPSASVGTTFQIGTTVAIASYDYSRATSAATKDAHELFGALSGPLTDRLNWTTYGIAGLSQGSPDFGVGLLITLRLQ